VEQLGVEGFSPAALCAELVSAQEVVEAHVAADAAQDSLLDGPGCRSCSEACGLYERPSVADVLADALVTAGNSDLDCAKRGVMQDVHHGWVGQIEAVGGAVAAGPFAAADLGELRGYLVSAGHVLASPSVVSAGVGLQRKVTCGAHLLFGLIGVVPLLGSGRRVPAAEAAATAGPDGSKPGPDLTVASDAPAMPWLVAAVVWLYGLQAGGDHVHDGLLGIA